MQTITITLEVPDGTDIEWLKSELQKYANKLIKEMTANRGSHICAEPAVKFGVNENTNDIEELNDSLFSKKISREEAWRLVKQFPKRDINKKFSEQELLDRLSESQQDAEEGNTRTEEEMDNYMNNLLESLAS